MSNVHKILIVDDDTELREALVEQLALHEEFEASAVESGADHYADRPRYRFGHHPRP